MYLPHDNRVLIDLTSDIAMELASHSVGLKESIDGSNLVELLMTELKTSVDVPPFGLLKLSQLTGNGKYQVALSADTCVGLEEMGGHMLVLTLELQVDEIFRPELLSDVISISGQILWLLHGGAGDFHINLFQEDLVCNGRSWFEDVSQCPMFDHSCNFRCLQFVNIWCMVVFALAFDEHVPDLFYSGSTWLIFQTDGTLPVGGCLEFGLYIVSVPFSCDQFHM